MDASGKTVEVPERPTTRPPATKCRNNKVPTAKGQRDRRVRLSADIAIQFFDVQDRLGYDRASDTIDWLIGKSKDSIDKLSSTSSQYHYDHHVQLSDLNAVHSGYLPEESVYVQNFNNLSDSSNNLSEYNFMDNYSALFPHIHMTDAYESPATDQFSTRFSNLYDSSQGASYQEELAGINQALFPVPESHNEMSQ